MAPPKKSKKGEGFQSAAGLMRYFELGDEKAMKIDPKLIAALCIASIIIIEASKFFFKAHL